MGAALLALDCRSAGGPRPTELLALAAVSIPLTALLGYLLSMPELYGVPTIRPHTGMAIHSVVVLLILCVGILAARPDVGVVSIVTAGHAGGVMARRLLLGLLALVPAAVLIKVGERLGWWLAPATAALLMVSVLAEGVTFILLTASRLGRDDTARRAVETELRRSEEKLQGIVSIATDAIISVDDDQRITLYNEGAQQIFGWLPGEVLGKPLDVLIPERFRHRHRGHVRGFAGDPRRARKMGENVPAIWGLRKNGEEFRADAAISRVEIDGARLYTVVLRDVGEHVRYIEEQTFLARVGEVLASSLSFRETLEHVSDLVVSFVGDMCTVDLVEDDGGLRRLKIAHADPAKEALVEAVGRITPDPSHPEWRVLATKQPQLLAEVPPDLYRSVPRWGEPAGGAGDVSLTEALSLRSILAVPLNARGHLVGVLSIASCRAERRYGPADLRLAEELSRRVALALDNAHLYEVAQDAIQVRDRVLGVVAHDLRNPLNAILLNSDLMRRRAPEPERRSQRQVDGIRRAAVRMNRLIQDLLDIVRLEAGHLLIERHRVPSGALVSEAVEAARQRRRRQPGAAPRGRGRFARPARGPGPAAAGLRQPHRQRDQVHLPGRSHHRGRRAPQRRGPVPRDRHRPRDLRRGSAAPVQSLLASAQGRPPRRGPRASHRQGDRRGTRGAHLGGDPRRHRHHLPRRAAYRRGLTSCTWGRIGAVSALEGSNDRKPHAEDVSPAATSR